MSFLLNLGFAGSFVFLVLYLSWGLRRWALPGSHSLSLNGLSTFFISYWLVMLVSQLCLLLGVFRREMIWVLFVAMAACAHLRLYSLGAFLTDFRSEWCRLRRWSRPLAGPRVRIVNGLFLLILAYKVVRVLGLPPLAWDTLTYHAVKAAQWVQYGSYSPMVAPGGWGSALMHPPGGEMGASVAMLFFGTDFLFGASDLLVWVALAVCTYSIGRLLGLRSRLALVATVYAMTIPAIWHSVGSLYVDNLLTLTVLGAVYFTMLFWKTRAPELLVLSWLAIGLSLLAKPIAPPFAATLFVLQIGLLLKLRRPECWRAVGVGWVLGAMIYLPWVIRSIQVTGYPLSPLPIEIMGVTLGVPHPGVEWYITRDLTPSPYSWAAETAAVKTYFQSPLLMMPHLSAFSALFFLLFPFGVVALWRRTPKWWIVPVALAMLNIGILYSPSFSVLRLLWAGSSGRFLLVCTLLVIVLSLCAVSRKKTLASAACLALPLFMFVNMGCGSLLGLGAMENRVFPWVLAGLLAAIGGSILIGRGRAAWMGTLAAVILGGSFLFALNHVRDRTRASLIADGQCKVLHGIQRYWMHARGFVEHRSASFRIAVTSGPTQNQDNWYLYHFLGTRLQNEIVYVPITEDGAIVNFGPHTDREGKARKQVWFARVAEREVDYVLTFWPRSIEMDWMTDHPELFEWVQGDKVSWALFRRR